MKCGFTERQVRDAPVGRCWTNRVTQSTVPVGAGGRKFKLHGLSEHRRILGHWVISDTATTENKHDPSRISRFQ